jgi:arylsulfatase A-like enzyme
LRLDRDLGAFFKFLDKEVGKGQYTVFLTADHGVSEVPQFSIDHQLPGGYLDASAIKAHIAAVLEKYPDQGATFVEKVLEEQIFLNREAIVGAGADYTEVRDLIVQSLRAEAGIYNAYPTEEIMRLGAGTEFPLKQLSRGLYPPLAGDIAVLAHSGWMYYGPTGSTHGSAWNNDTHVPLIFYGKGIPKGITYRETNTRDIASTIAMMLRISLPNGSTGTPVHEVLR